MPPLLPIPAPRESVDHQRPLSGALRVCRAVAIPAVALVAVACETVAPSQEARDLAQVRAQEAAWLSLGIHHYAFDTRLVPSNISPTPANDSLQVIVARDTIQSVFDLQTRAYVDRSLGVTIAQLFSAARMTIAATATDGSDSRAVVQYDFVYHFPTLIASGTPDEGSRTASDLLTGLP